MANRRLFQFLYSREPKLTMVNGIMTFAAGGKIVGSATSAGIYSVVGFGNGQFQIKCTDNYYRFIGGEMWMRTGLSASTVNISSLVGSSSYQIVSVGNSNWATVGFDTDYYASGTTAPTAGQVFVAKATVGSGTGTAKLLVPSNISTVEIFNGVNSMLTNTSPNYGAASGATGRGSSIFFQTLAPSTAMVSSAAVTTMVATNPVGSSQMSFKLWFRDSSANP